MSFETYIGYTYTVVVFAVCCLLDCCLSAVPEPFNMPQKPLKIAKKIDKNPGNRHGKAPKMKKGAQSVNNSNVMLPNRDGTQVLVGCACRQV